MLELWSLSCLWKLWGSWSFRTHFPNSINVFTWQSRNNIWTWKKLFAFLTSRRTRTLTPISTVTGLIADMFRWKSLPLSFCSFDMRRAFRKCLDTSLTHSWSKPCYLGNVRWLRSMPMTCTWTEANANYERVVGLCVQETSSLSDRRWSLLNVH